MCTVSKVTAFVITSGFLFRKWNSLRRRFICEHQNGNKAGNEFQPTFKSVPGYGSRRKKRQLETRKGAPKRLHSFASFIFNVVMNDTKMMITCIIAHPVSDVSKFLRTCFTGYPLSLTCSDAVRIVIPRKSP